MKGKYIRRGLSFCAALLMIGAFAGCDGGGTESGASDGSDASSNRVVELPKIEVKNHTLKVLTHDAQTTERTLKTLEKAYGINDVPDHHGGTGGKADQTAQRGHVPGFLRHLLG